MAHYPVPNTTIPVPLGRIAPPATCCAIVWLR